MEKEYVTITAILLVMIILFSGCSELGVRESKVPGLSESEVLELELNTSESVMRISGELESITSDV